MAAKKKAKKRAARKADPAPAPVSREDAQEVLRKEQEARAQACGAEMTAALEKHGCTLTAWPIFTEDGRVSAGWGIRPS